MKQFPHVPEALLRALEERFPDRLPDFPVDAGDQGVLVGQQRVIRFLRSQLEQQAEAAMNGA